MEEKLKFFQAPLYSYEIFMPPPPPGFIIATSERAGSILFFAYGKNRAFPLDCVFNPPRGLAIPYMGNITIFGVQNGTCCVFVLF